MGINVYWDNPERTVIVFDFDEQWTVEEFIARSRQTQQMMLSVGHPVAMITLFSQGIQLPKGFFQSLYTAQKMLTPNFAGTTVVADTPFGHSVFNLLSTVVPGIMMRVQITADEDTAREMALAMVHANWDQSPVR